MLRVGRSPQAQGLTVPGEEEEAWRGTHGKMEKRSSEGGGRGGDERLRKAPEGGLGTQVWEGAQGRCGWWKSSSRA